MKPRKKNKKKGKRSWDAIELWNLTLFSGSSCRQIDYSDEPFLQQKSDILVFSGRLAINSIKSISTAYNPLLLRHLKEISQGLQ